MVLCWRTVNIPLWRYDCGNTGSIRRPASFCAFRLEIRLPRVEADDAPLFTAPRHEQIPGRPLGSKRPVINGGRAFDTQRPKAQCLGGPFIPDRATKWLTRVVPLVGRRTGRRQRQGRVRRLIFGGFRGGAAEIFLGTCRDLIVRLLRDRRKAMHWSRFRKGGGCIPGAPVRRAADRYIASRRFEKLGDSDSAGRGCQYHVKAGFI